MSILFVSKQPPTCTKPEMLAEIHAFMDNVKGGTVVHMDAISGGYRVIPNDAMDFIVLTNCHDITVLLIKPHRFLSMLGCSNCSVSYRQMCPALSHDIGNKSIKFVSW